jgi:hypothetical protein
MDNDKSVLYDQLKQRITNRYAERVQDCVNTDNNDKILKAQGAARELKDLLDTIDQLENGTDEELDNG